MHMHMDMDMDRPMPMDAHVHAHVHVHVHVQYVDGHVHESIMYTWRAGGGFPCLHEWHGRSDLQRGHVQPCIVREHEEHFSTRFGACLGG